MYSAVRVFQDAAGSGGWRFRVNPATLEPILTTDQERDSWHKCISGQYQVIDLGVTRWQSAYGATWLQGQER